MDYKTLWFSFRNRTNRAKYWLVTFVNVLIIVVLAVIGIATNSTAFWVLIGILFIPLVVSAFAVTVKRLHDRDKSAWWLLPFYVLPGILQSAGEGVGGAGGLPLLLISFALSVWAFVELGCLRGTDGANSYGPDPLAGQG